MKSSTDTPIDRATVKALKAEAQKNYTYYRRRFQKWDNSEDMHAMDAWDVTRAWLGTYLAGPK